MIKIKLQCVFLYMLFTSVGNAQVSDSLQNRRKITGFPIAYYAPETGLAFGALGNMTWNWKKDSLSARKSSLTAGFAYTTRKQILFYLPYNLFFKNDAYRLNGELGYYDYVYYFFGIGNVEGTFEDKQEEFLVSFPRLRATAYKKVSKDLFLGVRYAFDFYYDLFAEGGGYLIENQPLGMQAGINSGFGPALIFDSRDQIFYPRKGWYVDASSTIDLGKLVSDYQFTRLTTDLSYFWSPMKKSVLGFNFNYQQNTGNVPFYQLSLLGGSKRLRGQFEGEFRDHFTWQTQIEWRQEFMKNWGFTAFLGMGWIAPDWKSLQWKNQKIGSGVGLRYKLNKKDHVNIRLDLGYGNGKFYPYLTIGEAF